jgi:hypothetical protein
MARLLYTVGEAKFIRVGRTMISEQKLGLDQYVVLYHPIPQCLNVKQRAERRGESHVENVQVALIPSLSSKTVDKRFLQVPDLTRQQRKRDLRKLISETPKLIKRLEQAD